MNKTLNRISPYFAYVGFLLLAAGLVAFYITRRWDLVPNLLLGVGLVVLLLFAILRPDDVRLLFSGQRTRYGLTTGLSVLFFVAIVVLGYYLTFENNDWRFDATESNEFTPLPETVAILEALDEPVHVIGFYSQQGGFQQQQALDSLESFSSYSDQLSYEFVDPFANPLLAQQYDISADNVLVFTKGSGENEVFSSASTTTDRDLHSALVRIVNPVEKKLYFITGHGERSIEDGSATGLTTAAQAARDAGFQLETVQLAVTGAVPADATAVVLIDQLAPMQPAEIEALQTYLNEGGAALIARDALDAEERAAAEEDDLNSMLATDWGLTLRTDFIVEVVLAQAGQTLGLSFLGFDYGSSSITSDLDNFGTLFDLARSIETNQVEGVTYTDLILTSEQAWGETNIPDLSQGLAEPDEGEDALGPLAVAVSAENFGTGARLVLFGDTDFVSNSVIQNGGNSLLFSNALNWLANDELAVELTPREQVNRQVVVPQNQLNMLFLLSICLGPLVMGAIGIGVWYSRRQRQ